MAQRMHHFMSFACLLLSLVVVGCFELYFLCYLGMGVHVHKPIAGE